MKKLFKSGISLLLLAVILVSSFPSAQAASNLKINVNGKPVIFSDAQPYIDENNRTMVPVRMIAEAIEGTTVTWEPEMQKVIIRSPGVRVDMQIGYKHLFKVVGASATEVRMDTAAIIREDRTFVPIRFIVEALNMQIDYDGTSGTVNIVTRTLSDEDLYRAEVIRLTNIERTSRGLSEVKEIPELSKAADIRAKEIKTKFTHARPNGDVSYSVISEAGIRFKDYGENIAKGYFDADEVMKGWMDSEGHRGNLLNPTHEYIGVGVYIDGTYKYWVQTFIS